MRGRGMQAGWLAAMALAGWSEAGLAGRTVQLSKVIEDTETTPPIVKVKVGTICLFAGSNDIERRKKTMAYERMDNLFTAKLRAAGYTVVTTSQDLFAGASPDANADYLIGAVIHPTKIEICDSIDGVKGSYAVDVDWQVYDRAAQKVVMQRTTSGTATQGKFDRNGIMVLFDKSFVASLTKLLEETDVQALLGAESAPPPAPMPVVAPVQP
jgi:hypothetical protein